MRKFDKIKYLIYNRCSLKGEIRNMDIFKSLEADKSKLKEACKHVDDLVMERDTLIAQKVAEINKEYETSLNVWDKEAKSKEAAIKEKTEQIKQYSTFDAYLLGEAIRSLMEYVEGKEYVYSQVEHTYGDPRKPKDDNLESDDVRMVVQKNKDRNSFTSVSKQMSKIDDLVSQGYAVVLSESDFFAWDGGLVRVYNSKDDEFNCTIKFGAFDYVREFIELVIQYRVDNGLVKFSQEDMLKCLQVFALEYQSVLKTQQKELPSDRVLSFTYQE